MGPQSHHRFERLACRILYFLGSLTAVSNGIKLYSPRHMIVLAFAPKVPSGEVADLTGSVLQDYNPLVQRSEPKRGLFALSEPRFAGLRRYPL